MYKNILAIVLLIYGVFGTGWLDTLDNPSPQPEPPAPTKILEIETPSDNVKNRVKVISDLITDPSDRAKIAIFNYEFADRVIKYDASTQNVNDIYTLAGKLFFKKTLVDKYDGLAEEIVSLLEECMTDENHVLTVEEKAKLNEYFMGVAWVLIQKG